MEWRRCYCWSRSNYGAPELRSLDDGPRKFDLTSELSEGDRYRLHSHFRELMVRWEGQQWNAGIGRDTINWGTGIVFHLMGLFNPLPPLHVDGDDQLGQDHIMIERLWRRDASPTHSLSFWHVGRRNIQGAALSDDVSTTALNGICDRALRIRSYRRPALRCSFSRGGSCQRVWWPCRNVKPERFAKRDSRYSDSSWGLIEVVNAPAGHLDTNRLNSLCVRGILPQ